MKKFFIVFILAIIAAASAAAQNAAEISFTFTRQTGPASNQFAIWIEDSSGQLVKTIYAARWTAQGGYARRPTSIPLWVRISNLANMPRASVDAVSGATPATGALTYTWNGTNNAGAAVPAGDYVIVLEGTLRWENQVYYRAPVRLGQGAATPQVSVEYVSGERDTTAERAMLSNVRVRVLR
ncbi:MAG: DUF2271 domain-containing protein [Treponema sp.]|nr:DUF2271 domain-containing protein [Treponema sp.]MCL2237354.1 DUF2271 domain-containing protein [Treponema sp.]